MDLNAFHTGHRVVRRRTARTACVWGIQARPLPRRDTRKRAAETTRPVSSLQLTALLRFTAIRVYRCPGDSHTEDSAVADRIHGRPDQLLRPVLHADAQHRPRRARGAAAPGHGHPISAALSEHRDAAQAGRPARHHRAQRVQRRCAAVVLAHRVQVVPGRADRQEALRPDDQVAGQADQLRPVRASTPPAAPGSTTGSTASTSRPRWRSSPPAAPPAPSRSCPRTSAAPKTA